MESARFSVRWSHAGLLGLTIGAASLTALVITVTRSDVDQLSATALALAVLAFIAQLIIFIAQALVDRAQTVRMEELSLGMQKTLLELRSSSQGLGEAIQNQFNRLLDYALERTVPEAVEEASKDVGVGGSELNAQLAAAIERRLRETLGDSGRVRGRQVFIDERVRTWPDPEETRDFLALLESLSPLAVSSLALIVRADKDARAAGSERVQTSARRGLSPVTAELLTAGLVKEVADRGTDELIFVELTPLGYEVGRLMTAEGPAPDWVLEAVAAGAR